MQSLEHVRFAQLSHVLAFMLRLKIRGNNEALESVCVCGGGGGVGGPSIPYPFKYFEKYHIFLNRNGQISQNLPTSESFVSPYH